MFQKIENLWFCTSTINSWQKILDNYNAQIIIDSLTFMVNKNWIKIYGFVVMPNHIHLILSLHKKDKIAFQRDFLKHTAQLILENLKDKNYTEILSKLLSSQADRKYQVWERRPKWIMIENELILKQKLAYIHANPLQDKWNLCKFAEEYKYSSALFYEKCVQNFEFFSLFKTT